MRINNEIAEQIIDELDSSLPTLGMVEYALVALHERDDKHSNRDAQIVIECLKRVAPDITPDEYVQVASDVLRWHVDGDDLDVVCPRCKGDHSWCQQVQEGEFE